LRDEERRGIPWGKDTTEGERGQHRKVWVGKNWTMGLASFAQPTRSCSETKENVMASPGLLDRGSRLTKIIRILVAGKSAILCHAVEAVVAVLRAGVVTCEREEVRRIAVRHNNTNARTVTGVDGVGGVGQGYSTADAEVRR
jgi:hypothetical protein